VAPLRASDAGAGCRENTLQSIRSDQGLAARRLSSDRGRHVGIEPQPGKLLYFAEIAQAAFSPSNIVPGIGFSPDKMLQARIFSYPDAHRHRLGTHYEALPVNAPKCPVHNYHKDGQMRFFPNNPNPDAYYEPNSFDGPVENASLSEPPLRITGDADRFDHRHGNDDYSQPRALFNLFDKSQKSRLFSNIAEAMQGVPDFIIERQLGLFEKVSPDYVDGVRAALGQLVR